MSLRVSCPPPLTRFVSSFQKRTQHARQAILAASIAVGAMVACAGEIAVDGRPCPCSPGFTCCADLQACYTTCPDFSGSTRDPLLTTHVSFSDVTRRARCLTQDDHHVYFLSDEGRMSALVKATGAIVDSAFAAAAQKMPRDINPACSIVLQGNAAYFTLFGRGKVGRVALGTPGPDFRIGPEGELLGDLITPTSLALSGTDIYVTELDAQTIKRVYPAEDGRSPERLTETLTRTGPHPREVIVTEDALFWIDDGGLRRMNRTGGAVSTLSTENGEHLTVHGSRLYWIGEEGIVSVNLAGLDERRLAWTAPVVDCPASYSNGSPAITSAEAIPRFGGGVVALALRGQDLLLMSHAQVFQVPLLDLQPSMVRMIFDYRVPCGKIQAADLVVADGARAYWSARDGLRSRPL